MLAKLFIALVCLPLAVLAGPAEKPPEKLPLLKVGNDVYTNVVITKVTATDIYFTAAQGMGNAKLEKLSPELRQHFGYNATNALAMENKIHAANTNYLAQLARQPAAKPAANYTRAENDKSDTQRVDKPLVRAAELSWSTDFNRALKQAADEDKLVLLDFTGSDWCSWCMKFDRDILSTDTFATYAKSRLVLVKVDFPRGHPLPTDQQKANSDLAGRYKVSAYPTFILVTAGGRELGRQTGYLRSGPKGFVSKLISWGQ